MFIDKIPLFDIGDYILREKTMDDAEAFLEYYANPLVHQYITSPVPRNIYEARNELRHTMDMNKNGSGVYFAIARKSDNRMIGSIGMFNFRSSYNRGELSYDLSNEYWGSGIMSSAIDVLLEYFFNILRINRIEAHVIVDNNASERILKKHNFTFEGEMKQHRYLFGRYVDVKVFRLLFSEWKLTKNVI